MARKLQTYKQQELSPTPTRAPAGLGSTYRQSGGDPVAGAMQGLGGSIQQVGAVVKQYAQKRKELKDDGDRSNWLVNYTKQSAGIQADIDQKFKDGEIALADVAEEYNTRITKWNGEYVGESDYDDSVKSWAIQKFEQDHAGSMAKMESWVRGREDERNAVNIEIAMQSAISENNLELAEELKNTLGRHTTPQAAQTSFDSATKQFEMNGAYAAIATNPRRAIDDIDAGVYNVGEKEKKILRAAAVTAYNGIKSQTGNSLKSRVFGIEHGNPVTPIDTLEQIVSDTNDAAMLDPTTYDSVLDSVDKIFENKSKTPMDAVELSDLLTRIGEYNASEDASRSKFAELHVEVAAIKESRDFSQANQLLELVEKGGVASVHWNDINKVIDQDMKPRMDGMQPSLITPETGLLAKREVAQFLRENPTDADGAIKLYTSIKANDVQQFSKNFYRNKYQYGGESLGIPSRRGFGFNEPLRFGSEAAVEEAGLADGTPVIVNGKAGIYRAD
jgi:hypothetical protein